MGRRIIFSVTNDLGTDQRMHRICSTLVKAGFDVGLVGRRLPQSVSVSEHSFRTHRLSCLFNRGKLFYAEFNLRLFFFLVFRRCDIYCAIDLDTLLPNLLAAKIRGRKLSYDAHEYFTEVPEVIGRPLVKKIWKWVERVGVPCTDAAYTVSASLAGLFKKEYGKSFAVIRNFPRKDVLPVQDERDYLLYQGALNEGRGLEALMEAMTVLECRLVIAGEGDLSLSLREMARQLGVMDKVQFMGRLNPAELKEVTKRAFLGYNVLENKGMSYYYSLANKCFDYVQAGVPVLCSKFPEYSVLAEEHPVFIFAAPEKDSIASAVNRFLQDRNLAEDLVRACLEAREKWNWEMEESKLITLYEELA